ncbi:MULTISPECIES: DUF4252 domain-containing protein [unclassified Myroides]|uniref:DUF4252 domain-containing protein n=1 Tax=unclassified Myroides TaxID=2642485 RepID=UPI0031013481
MNKILHFTSIVFFALFSVSMTYAQDDFAKFEKNKQINNVIVNKKMFEMMANVKVEANTDEERAYFNLIKKLTMLKVFNSSASQVKPEMKTTVNNYISAQGLKEVLNKKDNNSTITIYIDKDGNSKNASQLVMFNEGIVDGQESIIMLITGQFSLDELTALTNKMKLPLGNTLKTLK